MANTQEYSTIPAKPARLTYYIYPGILEGYAGDEFFSIRAFSGGGGGVNSKTRAEHKKSVGKLNLEPIEPSLINNPFAVNVKTQDRKKKINSQRGGPLPPIQYVIKKPAEHPHFKLSAQLVAQETMLKIHGRTNDFFIHGRGKIGSNGCIVPLNPSDFQRLMSALKLCDGGVLEVKLSRDYSVLPLLKAYFPPHRSKNR